MNSLGRKMLKIMESTPVQGMSVHILSKQSHDAGFDFESITYENVPMLMENLESVLPFFMPKAVVANTLEEFKKLEENNR